MKKKKNKTETERKSVTCKMKETSRERRTNEDAQRRKNITRANCHRDVKEKPYPTVRQIDIRTANI